jgi:hypothetical protein
MSIKITLWEPSSTLFFNYSGQKISPRRPNREGKNNDSVQRSTRQPSNTAGSWPSVRSRLGGNMITPPGPPQHTTEDVAMGSIFKFSATTFERIMPNASLTPLSASPRIEVRPPAQGQTLNPPEIASPHHASGDIAMHTVANLDNAKEGTSSSINAAPLHVALPPAVRPADKESPSAPVITSAGVCYSFDDDIYGDEPMDSDDDQTVMGDTSNNETLVQDSRTSQKSSGPDGVEASAESTANLMYTPDTNASVSTPIVEVKEEDVTSSEAEVNKTTNPDGPVAALSPAADTISEVEAKPKARVSSENGASSYNQNLESGIWNDPSKTNDLPPQFDQASTLVQVVSATPDVMPMETNIILSTNNVEIAGEVIQEVDIDKNKSRVVEIGLVGGREQEQDAPLNPLELFASMATSPNVDAQGSQIMDASAKPLKPSAESAVLPSSEKEKAKKAAIPAPSSKAPRKLTKNPRTLMKAASTPSDDLKVPPDVTNSSKMKSSKNSKAKSKDNNTTMNPPAVPGNRPEDTSNTTKQIIFEKMDDQPCSSIATMSQQFSTESSFDTEKSTKVQVSPPTVEHMKPSKSKGRNKEKETGECHPDNAPTKAADSSSSSRTTDRVSKKEPTVAEKTFSPSPYFVPTGYSFAKKDSVVPVPGCALPSLS